MGELILTKTPVAANPYYMEELSLNIYSLEELSYYIYHNVWLLSGDFMSVNLVEWIGNELSLPELEKRLDQLVRDSAPLSLFVSEILTYDGYLTKKEIRDTISVISSFEFKTEAECRKMRADRLFDSGRTVSAVYEYENLLEMKENLTLGLYGDIFHNLGTCMAKLFFMKEASDCYKAAYEANRNRESLLSYLLSLLLSGDEEKFNFEANRFLLSDEEKDRIISKAQNASTKGKAKEFAEKLDRMKADHSDKDEYIAQLDAIIKEWQNEYRKICRL